MRGTLALAAAATSLLLATPSAPALQLLDTTGTPGTAEGQFSSFSPFGLAIDAAGNLYVADEGNNRVQQFDATGNFIRMWGWGVDDGTAAPQVCASGCEAGIAGSGDGQFNAPRSIHVDPAGNVYTGEFNNTSDRIQKFTSTGAFVTKWGTTGGNAESQFSAPFGIDTDTAGDVYVADDNFNRIQKFTSTGSFLRMWGWGVDTGASMFEICTSGCGLGLQGGGDGQFTLPTDVEIDGQGTVRVLDGFNNRMQQFTSEGAFLGKWGAGGSGDGQLDDPLGFAIGPDGHFYVADTDNNRVQELTPAGALVRTWGWGVDNGSSAFQVCTSGCQAGISGSGPGQFGLPDKIAVDCRGNVYVSEAFGNRIQKFGEAGVEPPPCTPQQKAADTDPPETRIDRGPKRKTQKRRAKFEFSSDEPGSTFACKLDKRTFKPCDASETFKVKRKRHRLGVRAVDPAGNVDPTPAERKWKVKKP